MYMYLNELEAHIYSLHWAVIRPAIVVVTTSFGIDLITCNMGNKNAVNIKYKQILYHYLPAWRTYAQHGM